MANPYFRFRQFTVYHDKCAMKVGTDGVLLGAWTDVGNAQKVLDVGTGSGLVALMLAQKNDCLEIDAIEIDLEATLQAIENVAKSPFSNITCINTSLQNFVSETTKKYDLIVSNPPFFTRSLKSPNAERNFARHTDSLLIEDFIKLSASLLSLDGRICFIFPAVDEHLLLDIAENENLYPLHITKVLPTVTSEPKRVLVELSAQKMECKESKLVIELERHMYTPEFKKMTQDFYL